MASCAPSRRLLCPRLPGLGPPHVGMVSTYGKDQSGTKTYQFNTLGYRGEEESASAQKRIYAGGCSITFGEGLDLEETWPQQFKQRYAAVSGIAADAVNVLNFAESGAANDRIVRTLLEQCRAAKPDLLLAQFTYPNRTEYLLGRHSINLGQWFLSEDVPQPPPEWLAVLQQIADHYYQFYTDQWGVAASSAGDASVAKLLQSRKRPVPDVVGRRSRSRIRPGAFRRLVEPGLRLAGSHARSRSLRSPARYFHDGQGGRRPASGARSPQAYGGRVFHAPSEPCGAPRRKRGNCAAASPAEGAARYCVAGSRRDGGDKEVAQAWPPAMEVAGE